MDVPEDISMIPPHQCSSVETDRSRSRTPVRPRSSTVTDFEKGDGAGISTNNVVKENQPCTVLQECVMSDSSVSSMRTARSVSKQSKQGKLWRKRSRQNGVSGSESSGSERSYHSGRSGTPNKKGRGRPPWQAGHDISLAHAKAELVRAERVEKELRAEQEMLAPIQEARAASSRSQMSVLPAINTDNAETAAMLVSRVMSSVASIEKVAATSGRLKGTYVKALKEAAATIKEDAKILAIRSTTEETQSLQKENVQLRAEMAELRKELSEIKAALWQRKETPTSSQGVTEGIVTPAMLEEYEARIMSNWSARLNARIEGLEPRLNLAPRLRPPLAHEKTCDEVALQSIVTSAEVLKTKAKQKPQTTRVDPERDASPTIDTGGTTKKKEKGTRRRKQKRGRKAAASRSTTRESRKLPCAPANTDKQWSTVAKGGKHKEVTDTRPLRQVTSQKRQQQQSPKIP
ncbi:unnamed protein product [Chilo suppressalis]|uniref:Gag-like protein n=1 Tax=Chilo suppressalis TaxID=168631 RepID=A0ABN8APP0_CHISP|nr:unnamed protein product [Chilo suppressalis]